MRSRLLAPLLLLAAAPTAARGGVVVIGNYANVEVAFSVAEPEAKARSHKLPANHVAPGYVAGPADLTFSVNGKATPLRLDPYHAYVFLPAPPAGLRLDALGLPAQARG